MQYNDIMSIEEISDIYITKVKEILDLHADFRFIYKGKSTHKN